MATATNATLFDSLHVLTTLGNVLQPLFGPDSMDVLCVTRQDECIATNDGLTFLRHMHLTHPIARLVLDAAEAQKHDCGDGSTSLVLMIAALAQQIVSQWQDKSIVTPMALKRMIQSLFRAREEAFAYCRSSESGGISVRVDDCGRFAWSMLHPVPQSSRRHISDLCLEAARCNTFECSMVEYATLRESRFLKGVFLSGKQLSNSIEIRDARIASLSFPLQLPRLKTKHSFVASSLTDVADLYAVTKTFLKSVVSKLTSLHVTLVVCQWAVDDTVLSALKELEIGVIAYVSGQWMERVASASGGFVCARLDQLQAADLGSCPTVRYDADFDGVFLEACPKQTSVGHLIVCGGTNTEVRRAVCDACLVLSKCVSTSAALGCFGGGRFETQLGKELAGKGHAIVAAALQSIADLLTPQTSDEDAVVPLAVKLGWIGRAIDVICMVLKIDAIVS